MVSVKTVGSYTNSCVRVSHLGVDFIGAFEAAEAEAEELKQVANIRARVIDYLQTNQTGFRPADQDTTAAAAAAPDPYCIPLCFGLLRGQRTLRVYLYLQDVFSEESYESQEHWKRAAENTAKLDTKHRTLLKLLRMWRYRPRPHIVMNVEGSKDLPECRWKCWIARQRCCMTRRVRCSRT